MKSKQPHGKTLEQSVLLVASSYTHIGMGMDTTISDIKCDAFERPVVHALKGLHAKSEALQRLERRMDSWDDRSYRFRGEFKTAHTAHCEMKVLGRNIGELVKNIRRGDSDIYNFRKICSLINNNSFIACFLRGERSVKNTILHSLKNNVDELNDLESCDNCGGIHLDTIHPIDNEEKYVCSDCLQNYVWSDIQDGYIYHLNAYRAYITQRRWDNQNSDNVTEEFAQSENLYWDDYENAYFGRDVDFRHDNEEEEYSSDNYDGLSEYHNTHRNFVVIQADPNALYKNMPPLGLELEVYSSSRCEAVEDIRGFNSIGKLILERDGSLSEAYGFEIITDPLGYTEWTKMGPRLCEAVRDAGCVAYNHPDDNEYGIHITLERAYMSPLQEARLLLFMTAAENLEFMRAIAQRNGIYSARLNIGSLNKPKQNIQTMGGLDWSVPNYNSRLAQKKILGAGKYAPINFKGHLAEVRIFQATLHTPSFMKNLEFVWAMVEWVRSSTGSLWRHEDFIKWLGQRGTARHDYPNLYDYLIRPTYRIKGYGFVIRNTWAKYLPIPNPVKGVVHVPPQPVDDCSVRAA